MEYLIVWKKHIAVVTLESKHDTIIDVTPGEMHPLANSSASIP